MADIDKDLHKAIEWSLTQLEEPRKERFNAIQQFVGSHYSHGGSDKHVPVNMLELAVTIYTQNLAARAPRVMVSTGVDRLKPFAKNAELALNQVPEEIGLDRTMRLAVMEALFGIGVVKVGLCPSGVALMDGDPRTDPGRPFVDLITPDDYFFDMAAQSIGGICYEGNDYWLPLEAARSLQDGGAKLEPDEHTLYGDNGQRKVSQISSQEGAETYKDKVLLRDVWLPETGEMLTYQVKSKKLIRKVMWDGPENGPYYKLAFNDVPGNLLPLPPASLWIDLHELGNRLFRKLSKQADGKKSVIAFAGGNDEDVNRLKDAQDGDGIRYNGARPEMLTVGGVDSETLAFFLQTRDLFSYFGGNLDALGGLAPMTDTVGQDELLTKGASARMSHYRSGTISFARGVWKALAWYEWTDPVRERVVEKPVEGTGVSLQIRWSAETREGDFLDFNFQVDPHSMEDDSPALRLQKLQQAVQQYLIPLLPFMQAQGAQLDIRKLVDMVAKLSNLDELRELVVFSEPIPGDPQQGGSETPSFKPAHTTRTYERVNRPGATRHGKDDAMTRLLMGGGIQPSEASALGRRVS